jgi:hypothetical protein
MFNNDENSIKMTYQIANWGKIVLSKPQPVAKGTD